MITRLEAVTNGHQIYRARRAEYDTGQRIPFRVSPEPFMLTRSETREVGAIGRDVAAYFHAVDGLYRRNDTVRGILDTGKPEIFLGERPTSYLFARPDLIKTNTGFTICEVETSPFGLALAEILNRGYSQAGFETMVGDDVLGQHVRASTSTEGTLLYSPKTASYAGQMRFLADEVFSGEGRAWTADSTTNRDPNAHGDIYRGFYLAEYMTDQTVRPILEITMANGTAVLPSPTPHMEEKALLALLWDTRFEQALRQDLGDASFNHLREVIPPTWIVGQEAYFAPGLPGGVETTADLATLAKSKRTLVLKSSGFGTNTSWGEGVHFLHKKSGAQAKVLLTEAQQDNSKLHVVQDFRKATDIPMEYEDNGDVVPMMARVRITPYFTLDGRLVAIKATGSENTTDFIHASSTSINTAVASR